MSGFGAILAELKRRRVGRALFGWGVAAFAILQVTEPVMHALDLGDWVLKAVVAVLAAGFPVTAGLAWMFDLTAKGVERTPPAAPKEGGGTPVRLGRPRLALMLLLIGTVAAAPGAAWLLLRRAPEPEPAPGARVPVAVADFENTTGEPELDSLSGLLITSLEQSRRLEVMTRSRMVDVLRQLGHGAGTRIDEPLGRELGRQAGIRALVVAAIRRFDALYTIELKALDPATSAYLFTIKEEGQGKASVPGMIDRLSERTRERLRERPAEVAASRVEVAQAVTPSLEAYQHYFAGRALADGRAEYTAGMREFRLAVEKDPTFAMAWYQIAYLGEWVDDPPEARRAALEKALQRVALVGEKERALMLAWKAHQDGRDDEATALYARAVQAFPGDKALQFFAGDLPYHAALSPRGSTVDLLEVLPRFQAAVALEPTDGESQGHLVTTLMFLGRAEEALAAARAWVAAAPTSRAFGSLGTTLALAGQEAEALEAYRRAADQGLQVFSVVPGAALLGIQGRVDEAAALLASTPTASAMDRLSVGVAKARLLLVQGRYREALAGLDGLPDKLALEARRDVPARLRAGILAARGDVAGAAKVAKGLLEAGAGLDEVPLQLALAGDLPHAAEAARALVEGSPQRALHDAVAAWKSGRPDHGAKGLEALSKSPLLAVRTLADALRAELELERGHAEAARAPLERALAYTRATAGVTELTLRRPRLLVLAARSHQRAGDPARARERLDELLGAWKRADPDLPVLREARSLRAELAAGR